MAVSLNDRERRLYDEAKSFSMKHLAPLVELVETGEKNVKEIFGLLNENGYCSLLIPKEKGGKGYSFLETALIYQGLAYGSGTIAFMLQLHNNITYEISELYSVSNEVKALLPGMINGNAINSFAFTEEMSGSDAASIKAYAELKDDGYHIYGEKVWIANAADASHFNVIVRDGHNQKNMIMLLVDKETPGFSIGESRKRFGGNALSCCDLKFDDCIVSPNRLISKNGFRDALKAIDIARIFVPAIATGISVAAIEQAIEYLSVRESFGEKIIEQQGIQWSLAILQTKVESIKWMMYHCATLMDEKKITKIDTAMNKLISTDVALEVALQCMQFQGANGYMENSNMSRIVTEAKMFQLTDGTSEIQKIIIGKALKINN